MLDENFLKFMKVMSPQVKKLSELKNINIKEMTYRDTIVVIAENQRGRQNSYNWDSKDGYLRFLVTGEQTPYLSYAIKDFSKNCYEEIFADVMKVANQFTSNFQFPT